MKILLFGVSNVGKTAVSHALSEEIDYAFYDLDKLIIRKYGSIKKFQKKYPDQKERDAVRLNLVKEVLSKERDCVIAMSPVAYLEGYDAIFHSSDTICIELYDTSENIFKRLVFTDDKGNVLHVPDTYLQKNRMQYIRQIDDDLNYFHSLYKKHMNMIHMNGLDINGVIEKIINELGNV